MLVLVANLASDSFRYKLLEVNRTVVEVGGGAYDGLGQPSTPIPTHLEALNDLLGQLPRLPDAVAFKAMHGGSISGPARISDQVIAVLEQFSDASGGHGALLVPVIRALRQRLPKVPQVAVFDTSFHQTIPPARQVYGIPHQWTETMGIRRYGFHGIAHRAITLRVAERLPEAKQVISCHLGQTSSVCAIDFGKSVASSFGFTMQSGLPQGNRVGDLDVFALQKLLKQGLSLEEILQALSRHGGLLGISGVAGDLPQLEKAAAEGNSRAQLALDAFVEAIRHYLGAYLVVLGGCQALAFSGEIGETSPSIRQAICRNLAWAGIELDLNKNAVRHAEEKISTVESSAEIWVLAANEDALVARQAATALAEMTN